MHAYHAHIYFTLAQTGLATQVRHNILQAIPELSYTGQLIPMPIGPHPLPMFELHIPTAIKAQAIASIDALRTGLSVLIHPLQQDELAAHSTDAIWLGRELTLNLAMFNHPRS